MCRFDHRRPASKKSSNGCLTYEFQRFVDSTKGLACLPIGFGKLFLKPCFAMFHQRELRLGSGRVMGVSVTRVDWPAFESIVMGIYLSPISHLMNPRVTLINESILRTSIRFICIPCWLHFYLPVICILYLYPLLIAFRFLNFVTCSFYSTQWSSRAFKFLFLLVWILT